MTAFRKDLFRMIIRHRSRFLTMLFIILVGICFVTGIGGISPKVLDSIDEDYRRADVPDLIIKSKKETGFTSQEIDAVKKASSVSSVKALTKIDSKEEGRRITVLDLKDKTDKLRLIKGRFPEDVDEVLVEQKGKDMTPHKIGERISLYGMDFTIVGIVKDPLVLSTEGDRNQMDPDHFLKDMVYISKDHDPFMGTLPVTDLYISFKGMSAYFDDGYLTAVKEKEEGIEAVLPGGDYACLDPDDSYGYAYIKNIMDKVDVLALVFPVFFILVTGLLTLTNMSRLIDEERAGIGCLTSLGYSRPMITGKYMAFALISTLIGETGGLALGVHLIPDIVYRAVKSAVYLPEEMTDRIYLPMGIISSIFMLMAVLLVTFLVAWRSVSEKPAALFCPRAGKKGRRILLERIPFLWDRLSFRYKSTWRNIFRFRGRFFMIVISIAGSTTLVMAGLGLYDCVGDLEAINYVSLAILAFALLLSVLVLFNITTMNIGERTREIATLEVLGYKGGEVAGFIYREIVIMAVFGILIGIPAGTIFLYFVFRELSFGGLDEVHFYTYLIAFALSLLFVFLVVLLTCPSIKKVDMNESLKSLE